jgi:VWFA-related protein
MKLRNDFLVHFSLALGVCALAGAGLLAAQQGSTAAAPEPAKSSSGQAASDRTPVQQGEGTQSFTVKPGTLDEQEAPFVFRTTTRRVVVDVVVTGPDGQPVPDLTEKDFTVSEDHKPQSVRAFEVHSPQIDISLLPPAPQLPSHTFVNLEQTPASGPPVLLLLDYLNTPVTDQLYAHQQIVSFLERKPATMEVAIFALGDNLTLVQGFTTDTSRLLAAMRSKAARPRISAQSIDILKAQITLDAFLDLGRFLAATNGRKNLLWFSESFNMMVLPKAQDADSGTLIFQSSASSPNLGPSVTVTPANMMPSTATMGTTEASPSDFGSEIGNMIVLREEMRKVDTALTVSQTAVYPIDVRGLANDPGFSASAVPPTHWTESPQGLVASALGMPTAPGSPPASVQSSNDWIEGMDAAHATMTEIAEATGGHAFVNTNGLAVSAVTAVREGSSYYTLVYAPANLKFDGGLRSIHVVVDKPGCKLAYRSAYFAMDPATVTPNAVENDSLAAAAVHGAPEAQGLIFKAQIDPNGAPAMAMAGSPLAIHAALNSVKKSKKPQQLSGMVQEYEIRMAILAKQLQLTALADGRHKAALEIAVYAYAEDGQMLGGMKQKLEALMPPGVYAQAVKDGMFHKLRVELPVEAATMRLAVLDPGNHHAGSMEVALPLSASQPVAAAATVMKP